MYRHPMMNGPECTFGMQSACDDLLVIEAGDCLARPGVPFTLIRHRDFPELRSEGLTHREAARGLLRQLTAERDRVSDGWHREMLERVIGDVEELLERGDRPRIRGVNDLSD